MKKTLIGCMGFFPQPYSTYVRIDKLISAFRDNVALQKPDRKDCYEVPEFLHDMINNICDELEIEGVTEEDCEIFDPSVEYPPHIDKGGLTLTMPLSEGCILRVGNYTVYPQKNAVYMFDDRIPHQSMGPFLMISIGTTL